MSKMKYDYETVSAEDLVNRWNVLSIESNESLKKIMLFALVGIILVVVGVPLSLVLIGIPMIFIGFICCFIYAVSFLSNKERKEMKQIVKELRKRGYKTYQQRVLGTTGMNAVFELKIIK